MKKIVHMLIPSTQTDAKVRLQTTQRPFVVMTHTQTDGYGKFGREWISRNGNFTATFAVDVMVNHCDFGKISMLVCIQLCEVLNKLTGLKGGRIKWPNDILLNKKKIGGVLIEKIEETLLFGIGLNLNYSPELTNAAYIAGNVLDEVGVTIEPEILLDELSEYFASFETRFNEISAADVRQKYMTLLEGVGHEIKVVTRHETLMGRLQDINSDGALVLDMNGEHKLIYSADVFL
jgi:BirA family biotin operon repressor/biotin-[acetyl-CoA-carboxylase] ligase